MDTNVATRRLLGRFEAVGRKSTEHSRALEENKKTILTLREMISGLIEEKQSHDAYWQNKLKALQKKYKKVISKLFRRLPETDENSFMKNYKYDDDDDDENTSKVNTQTQTDMPCEKVEVSWKPQHATKLLVAAGMLNKLKKQQEERRKNRPALATRLILHRKKQLVEKNMEKNVEKQQEEKKLNCAAFTIHSAWHRKKRVKHMKKQQDEEVKVNCAAFTIQLAWRRKKHYIEKMKTVKGLKKKKIPERIQNALEAFKNAFGKSSEVSPFVEEESMLEKTKEVVNKKIDIVLKKFEDKVEILEHYFKKVADKNLLQYYIFGLALNATKQEYKHLKKKLMKDGKKLYDVKSKHLIGDDKILWDAHNCKTCSYTYASQCFYRVVKSFATANIRNKILNTNIAWRLMDCLIRKSKHDNWPGAGKKPDQGGSYLHKAIYDLQQSSD